LSNDEAPAALKLSGKRAIRLAEVGVPLPRNIFKKTNSGWSS
jgi:hypothetical protein